MTGIILQLNKPAWFYLDNKVNLIYLPQITLVVKLNSMPKLPNFLLMRDKELNRKDLCSINN